jgi:hypothetical protein
MNKFAALLPSIFLFYICCPFHSLRSTILDILSWLPEAEFLGQQSEEFSFWLFTVAPNNEFYSPPPCISGLKLVCNVNIVYGNLKSENSQDYAQKPRRNCTFMNSASGLPFLKLCFYLRYGRYLIFTQDSSFFLMHMLH